MDKDVLLSILGVIGGMATTIRWLLGFYFKKANEVENLKSTETMKAIDRLDKTLEIHESKQVMLEKKFDDFNIKLDDAIRKYSEFQTANTGVQLALKGFVEKTDRKFDAIETRIIKLGEDLFMYTSVKK